MVIAYLLIRTTFLGTLENPETRYTLESVSYTHLDVYKRQALVRAAEGGLAKNRHPPWAEQRIKELCSTQSGLDIRAGSSGDEHRTILASC